MNVLIVYWHPEPMSFNHAMFQKACESLTGAGHDVVTSDLHEMQFDPVSSRKNFNHIREPDCFRQQVEEKYATEINGFAEEIETEISKLERCDLMIWQFPLWWFGLPATLKGWVDRVFAAGRIYDSNHIYEKGIFNGKRALLALTAGAPEESYRKEGYNGDIAGILRPIHRGILQFVGFGILAPQIVYGPGRMTDTQRENHLQSYAVRLENIFSETPIDVGTY